MRASIVVGIALFALGCGAFKGYWNTSKHFPLGSVSEKELSNSLKKTYGNTQLALRERNYSIRKSEMGDEEAQIVAEKDGVKLIFDLTAVGEGTKIHLEMNQAGNDGVMWALLTDIEAFP